MIQYPLKSTISSAIIVISQSSPHIEVSSSSNTPYFLRSGSVGLISAAEPGYTSISSTNSLTSSQDPPLFSRKLPGHIFPPISSFHPPWQPSDPRAFSAPYGVDLQLPRRFSNTSISFTANLSYLTPYYSNKHKEHSNISNHLLSIYVLFDFTLDIMPSFPVWPIYIKHRRPSLRANDDRLSGSSARHGLRGHANFTQNLGTQAGVISTCITCLIAVFCTSFCNGGLATE